MKLSSEEKGKEELLKERKRKERLQRILGQLVYESSAAQGDGLPTLPAVWLPRGVEMMLPAYLVTSLFGNVFINFIFLFCFGKPCFWIKYLFIYYYYFKIILIQTRANYP